MLHLNLLIRGITQESPSEFTMKVLNEMAQGIHVKSVESILQPRNQVRTDNIEDFYMDIVKNLNT